MVKVVMAADVFPAVPEEQLPLAQPAAPPLHVSPFVPATVQVETFAALHTTCVVAPERTRLGFATMLTVAGGAPRHEPPEQPKGHVCMNVSAQELFL